MAIALRSVGTPIETFPTGETIEVPAPAGIQDGDILITVFMCDDGMSITTLSGWTAIKDVQDSSGNTEIYSYRKIASSESGNYTWTLNSGQRVMGVCLAYSGGNTGSPIDGTPTSSNSDFVAPSITVAGSDSILIQACALRQDDITEAGSMTQRYQGSASTRDGNIGDEVLSSSGATGTRTQTSPGGIGPCTIMFALASAAAGTTVLPAMQYYYRRRRTP